MCGTGEPVETAALMAALASIDAEQLAKQWTPDLGIWLMRAEGKPFLILDETYIGFSVKGPESITIKIKSHFDRSLRT